MGFQWNEVSPGIKTLLRGNWVYFCMVAKCLNVDLLLDFWASRYNDKSSPSINAIGLIRLVGSKEYPIRTSKGRYHRYHLSLGVTGANIHLLKQFQKGSAKRAGTIFVWLPNVTLNIDLEYPFMQVGAGINAHKFNLLK